MYEATPSNKTTILVEGEYGLLAQFLKWSVMALIEIGHYNNNGFSLKIILYAFDKHDLGDQADFVNQFDWHDLPPSESKEAIYDQKQAPPPIFPPKPVPIIQPQIPPQAKTVIKDEKQDKVKKQKKNKRWYCLWMCENCQLPIFLLDT